MGMKLHRGMQGVCARAILAALALLLYLSAGSALSEADGMLRVKLARLGSPSVLQLRSDCDCYPASDPSAVIPAGTEMTLSAEGNALTLTAGGHSLELGASARLCRSEGGSRGAQFISPSLSNRFCGDLDFTASSGVITTVLHIYVEDYLYGVVGNEIGPSSGLEALKAQAIVARNYALRQKAARSGQDYDLSDSGDALSFRGLSTSSDYANVLKAVDDTRGQVLYYGENPATCYYCDSNGGQIESSANAFGAALPYSTVRDDPYDLDGAGAKRSATLRRDASDLSDSLRLALTGGALDAARKQGLDVEPESVRIESIQGIEPCEALFDAPSRLYAALDFRVSASYRVNGKSQASEFTVRVPTYGALESWYDLSINTQDNETVWVSATDRAFEITFRRSGSGVGMSRRGAQVMARKGLSCRDILDFYYPGVNLRQLSLESTDAAQPAQTAAPSIAPIATARLSQKARLYEKADDTQGALTTLPAGAIVDVYAVQGDWAALGSGGSYGFAHTDALASFALIGVTAAQVREETIAQVSAKSADVLQLPVLGAKALARLSDGDTVRLTAYSDNWAMIITSDGVEGFIPRHALTLQENATGGEDDGEIVTVSGEMTAMLTADAGLYVNADDSVSPRLMLERGSRVRVLAYNRAWANVRTEAGQTGYVKLRSLAETQADGEGAGDDGEIVRVEGEVFRVVKANALPMYEKNDTRSAVLAILEKGKRVQLGAYNARWACVRADGVIGFVALEELAGEEATPKDGDEAIDGGPITRVEGELFADVRADGTVLFASWSTGSEALAVLGRGQRVQVGAYNAKWVCVRADGVVGFVEATALERVSE